MTGGSTARNTARDDCPLISVMSHNQQREFQESFTNSRGFTPQYSYADR